jgi:hypothetical protein
VQPLPPVKVKAGALAIELDRGDELRPKDLFEGVCTVRARDGSRYRLLESRHKDTGIQVNLVPERGGRRIGWAFTTRKPGSLQLNDIRIKTDAAVPPRNAWEWLVARLTGRWPRTNLQRLGLGT